MSNSNTTNIYKIIIMSNSTYSNININNNINTINNNINLNSSMLSKKIVCPPRSMKSIQP